MHIAPDGLRPATAVRADLGTVDLGTGFDAVRRHLCGDGSALVETALPEPGADVRRVQR